MRTQELANRRRWGPGGTTWCAVAAVMLMLASTSAAYANPMSELTCQSERATAAAKYTSCAVKALAKFFRLSSELRTAAYASAAYATAAGKCVTKYAATWPKLQAKAATTGVTCDHARFLDNGDGTVTDLLTALQWEKKTNLDGSPNFADPHDADNTYTWSAAAVDGTAADGTAFTSFLASLNSGGCFAGQCDWRLPTWEDLLTLATPAYPACTTPPCIDPALGPTVDIYWSGISFAIEAWIVTFDNGYVTSIDKFRDSYVRGVRSGL